MYLPPQQGIPFGILVISILLTKNNMYKTYHLLDYLESGDYIVKVQQFGNDGSYCYREETITVGQSATIYQNTKTINEKLEAIRLFPNPISSGNIHITTAHLADKAAKIELVNLTGKTISTYEYDRLPKLVTLELPDMESGVYLLKILPATGKITTRKVSVVRQ